MTDFNIQVGIDPSGARSGGSGVRRELRTIDNAAEKLNRTLRRTVGFLAGGAAITRGIGVLRDYSQQMSTVQAIAGATTEQMRRLNDAATRHWQNNQVFCYTGCTGFGVPLSRGLQCR